MAKIERIDAGRTNRVVARNSTFFLGIPIKPSSMIKDLGGTPAFMVFENCKFKQPQIVGFFYWFNETRPMHISDVACNAYVWFN